MAQRRSVRVADRSIEEAASGTKQIASVITEVAAAAAGTRDATEHTKCSAEEMSRMADGLGELVAQYT